MRGTMLNALRKHRLIAVLRLDNSQNAVPLSQCLLRGGIALQEFTLTNPQALVAIEKTRQQSPEFESGEHWLGAGSVTTAAQVTSCFNAGAQFIVSPILSLAVIDRCTELQLPCICGALTPTEIFNASQAGATAVKIFPARQMGPSYIRDILAPLPSLNVVPTGGIGLNNIRDFLRAGALAVGVGGELADARLVAQSAWPELETLAREYAVAASPDAAGKSS